MWSAWIVGGWTVAAMAWWGIAHWLTRQPFPRNVSGVTRQSESASRLTIFKPIPRVGTREELHWIAEGIESFTVQLDARSELLLGIHEEDHRAWKPYIRKWRAKCAPESLKVVVRGESDRYPNPKISWQRILAPRATGEAWLWSDADIIAPPGFLAAARAELAGRECRLLTNAYVIPEVVRPAGLFEALFVNVELYPGVLLLGRMGGVRFGFGAGMMFGAGDFGQRASWSELGHYLAEDFMLGKRLQPVGLGASVLNTFSHSTTWLGACLHYLRWQKTVRWCRPSGFAAQIAILPLIGWLSLIAAFPTHWIGWLGLVATWQLEVVAAYAICRRVGCRISWRHGWIVAGWSVFRAVAWLACWLPWPIRWRGQSWWSLRKRKRERHEFRETHDSIDLHDD